MRLAAALATFGLVAAGSAALGVSAGCSKTAVAPCNQSVTGILDRAMSASAANEPVVSDMEKRLGDALIKLCTEDRWSAPMLSCLDAATDVTSARSCTSKLSSTQLARFNKLLSELSGLPVGTPQQPSSPKTSSGN